VARQIRGPILAAPATSEDLKWAAVANVYGEVYLIDNQTGRRVDEFATENEISAAPVFLNGYLLAGSKDSYVYAYDLARQKVAFICEVSAKIETDPVTLGDAAFFASADGKLHRIDTRRKRVAWSTRVSDGSIVSLLARESHLLAAIGSGSVLVVNTNDGTVEGQWKLAASEPGGMRLEDDMLYVGYQNGLLAAWDIKKNKLAWTWQADASISTPPLVLDGKIFVACSSGTVQVLEVVD
jgi:outer membrane protein assembly factor BamB